MEHETIVVESMLGAERHEPIVQIHIPGHTAVQLDAAGASDLALSLLEAANAAQTDAFLLNYFMKRWDFNLNGAVRALREFRKWRAEHQTDRA